MLNLLGLIDKFQRELVVEGTLDGLALVIGSRATFSTA